MIWDGLTPPYRTIVVDPPWPYDDGWPAFSPTSHGGDTVSHRPLPYSSMTVEDVAALPVFDLADDDAHLYLWTTNRYLWQSKDIVLGWGFTPTRVLVWGKPPMGLGVGGLFTSTTEFVVFARGPKEDREVERAGKLIREARVAAKITRADLHRLVRGGTPTGIVNRWEDDDSLPNERDWARLQEVLPALKGVHRPVVEPPPRKEQARVDRSWWEWPRGPHSSKPPAFMDIVEQVSPGPYVELFARAQRLGWDSWGHGYEVGVMTRKNDADWLGRPMHCQVCGVGMDSFDRWQNDTGKGLVYGHELCLWPEGFPALIDGSERDA